MERFLHTQHRKGKKQHLLHRVETKADGLSLCMCVYVLLKGISEHHDSMVWWTHGGGLNKSHVM